MTIALAGGVGVALILIFMGLERVMRTDDPAFENRLRRYATRRAGEPEFVDQRQQSAMTSAVTAQVGRAIAGRSFASNLQGDLARADLKLTAAEFLTLQGIVTLLFAFIGYVLVGLIFGQNPLALPIFGLIGFILPKMWIGRRQTGRLKAFNEQLGDTIQLMSNSLRSGMSLLQSMDMVAREGNPPISDEFSRVTLRSVSALGRRTRCSTWCGGSRARTST